jgi:signal transduction histidine kinase
MDGGATDPRALVDALIAMPMDLDLHTTLVRIVEAATSLTDASYGALGVLDRDGELSDFISAGVDDETRSAIGPLPRGQGLLSLLHLAPGPVRLDDLTAHQAFEGFPADHPKMTSFLGLEVRVHGQTFGNLYITDKQSGVPFTVNDERMLQAFATGAGFVIENARFYELSEARASWLEASAAITRSLVGEDLDLAFQQVADLARAVSGATTSCLALLVDDDTLEIRVVSGPSDWTRGSERVPVAGSIAGMALGSREALVIADVSQHDAAPRLLHAIGRPATGPVAYLPLWTPEGNAGLLLLAWDRVGSASFNSFDLDLASGFAEQAALALEVSRVRAADQRRSLTEDRDRIARDLHDVVIQRLFAIGMQLDHAATVMDPGPLADLMSHAVDELDVSIKDIRTSIFKLQNAESGSLRAGVLKLVEEYTPILGFAPSVVVRGPVDQSASAACRGDVLAVLREALSNIARHAQASSADVSVEATPTHLRVVVCDDGCGLPEERSESGLSNARERAHARQGELQLSSVEPTGTRFDWVVTLD